MNERIFGIDIIRGTVRSGTTIGIAVLDFGGNLVYLASTRLFSAADLIREIISLGRSLIIAFDKAEMPFGVEKFDVPFLRSLGIKKRIS
ncbi:MAG: DUF460 domain-containing protein [Methanocalculaceae archaeon]|jgi:predicted RNase H-like nuclease (RuvC/YqgF family)|nr:DUF460 domain-containing protein [Methanocalculaceae archaeon]